jgi:hypothetical protein
LYIWVTKPLLMYKNIVYISMQSIFTLVSLVLGYGTTATIHLSKMHLLAML